VSAGVANESAHMWWSQRFLATVGCAGQGDRLERGRDYARARRVLDLQVEAGRLAARVIGSGARPYEVEVRMLTLGGSAWKAAAAAVSNRAGDAAQLLAGRVPEGLDAVLRETGVSLLPDEVAAECTCPDWAVPCKHIAAACYVFADQLDGDPFLLFRLRGRDRKAFVADMERMAEAARGESGGPPALAERPTLVTADAFWQPGAFDAARLKGPPLGLPQSLPEPDWWRGGAPLLPLLERIYAQCAAYAAPLGEPTQAQVTVVGPDAPPHAP
jgi:uncharacterized Zn finger protein